MPDHVDTRLKVHKMPGMNIDNVIITDLIEAAISADYAGIRRVGNTIAHHLASRNDRNGAKAIQSILRKCEEPLHPSECVEILPRDEASHLPLIREKPWPTTPLMLNGKSDVMVSRFIENARHIELLGEKGISTRLRLLVYGLPGTGKSLLAGHIAKSLEKPLYIARLDSLVSSRLDETTKNLRNVFEYVSAVNAVLFFDKMDTLAEVSDDSHELKRIVNIVLDGLESLADHVVTIAATNRPHVLDFAIRQQFPYTTKISLPDREIREMLWLHFLHEGKEENHSETALLAKVSKGLTGADIENIGLAARRYAVISGTAPTLAKILLLVLDAKSGNACLINNDDLDTREKKALSDFLGNQHGISQVKIARIIGVQRQTVSNYLKETKK